MSEEQAVAKPEEPRIEIVDPGSLENFVELLVDWHERQVATVNHLAETPEGMEVQIGDEPSFKLEGNTLQGFQLGLSMAMSYLGRLPFVVDYDPTVH